MIALVRAKQEDTDKERKMSDCIVQTREQNLTLIARPFRNDVKKDLFTKCPVESRNLSHRKLRESVENFKCVVDDFLIGKDAKGYGTKKFSAGGYTNLLHFGDGSTLTILETRVLIQKCNIASGNDGYTFGGNSKLMVLGWLVSYCLCHADVLSMALCSFSPAGEMRMTREKGENDTIRPAKVTVFEPSPEEIREKKKATVVCLVSDFYPDNIKIHWLVDGKEKDANDTNIHTDLNAILSKENTSYSISSRLRFDALDWARSKNVECRVDLYTNESVPATSSSTLAVKAEMCGISKEAKIQSMATAKLTYLILICKSIFYTIFISTIAWKTKTSYSKRFD
ncbi:M1-specific T cell receptor beta chain-like [Heterodontus francisci]|uniref:M1-specific T cell receptor beta chain-like n=1 Tax=Heterodontus francisci TaxID=7792 RepID=UPI00355BBE33